MGSAARMRVSSVDLAVRQGHVQVDPAEHAPALHVKGLDRARQPHSSAQSSTRRWEKPHSLSYQETTLAMRPRVIVSLESKIDE